MQYAKKAMFSDVNTFPDPDLTLRAASSTKVTDRRWTARHLFVSLSSLLGSFFLGCAVLDLGLELDLLLFYNPHAQGSGSARAVWAFTSPVDPALNSVKVMEWKVSFVSASFR